jgi:hypothetical protein
MTATTEQNSGLIQIYVEEKMSEEIDRDRRRFVATAALTIAAAQLGMIGSAVAQTGTSKLARVPPIKPGRNKCRRLLSKAMRMAPSIRSPLRMRANSRASTHTGL